ncbi:MAG: ABC transporter ATP-binding protein [Micromonosporaceae bacterium]|nr:ABC transporter ATP-binding protein [Micromonosporaceae bacterium]
MLEVTRLQASYGAVQAVRGVSFVLSPGEVLAVVGPNGAGKSTLANALAGVHKNRTGAVRLNGRDISGASPVTISRAGLTLAPQGRRVFASCTVAEHVKLAVRHARPGAMSSDDLLELFPRLRDRWRVRARSLSGGEQQMLAIARAVLPGPSVIVLDEPTEGLAPGIVAAVGELIRRLRGRGVATLLMEQGGGFPLAVADRVLTIERGVLRPPPAGPAVRTDRDPAVRTDRDQDTTPAVPSHPVERGSS